MTSARSGRPESSSSEQLESPERETQYKSYEASADWSEYNPSQVWEDEQPLAVEQSQDNVGDDYNNNYGSVEVANNESYESYAPTIDGFVLNKKMIF